MTVSMTFPHPGIEVSTAQLSAAALLKPLTSLLAILQCPQQLPTDQCCCSAAWQPPQAFSPKYCMPGFTANPQQLWEPSAGLWSNLGNNAPTSDALTPPSDWAQRESKRRRLLVLSSSDTSRSSSSILHLGLHTHSPDTAETTHSSSSLSPHGEYTNWAHAESVRRKYLHVPPAQHRSRLVTDRACASRSLDGPRAGTFTGLFLAEEYIPAVMRLLGFREHSTCALALHLLGRVEPHSRRLPEVLLDTSAKASAVELRRASALTCVWVAVKCEEVRGTDRVKAPAVAKLLPPALASTSTLAAIELWVLHIVRWQPYLGFHATC